MEQLLKQIEEWNKASEFSRAIAAIEAIPEEERGFLLTLWLGRLYGNLAVLGDYDQREWEDSRGRSRRQMPNYRLIQKSFQIFRPIQEEGEKDPTWNSRIAYSLWAMEEGQQALAYARRWLELAPDDPDAQELVSEIEGFLWDQEEDDTGRKDNAKWKDDNG